jgi:hypothetical protein
VYDAFLSRDLTIFVGKIASKNVAILTYANRDTKGSMDTFVHILRWHGRGHRFDPALVHQRINNAQNLLPLDHLERIGRVLDGYPAPDCAGAQGWRVAGCAVCCVQNQRCERMDARACVAMFAR